MTDAQAYVQALIESCKSISAKDAAERAGLALTQKGDRYWSKCFNKHTDKTESLVFYPDGRYYCFSCRASGDAVYLYQQMYNLPAVDAAKRLMSVFGMSPQSPTDVSASPIKPTVTAAQLKETVERTREKQVDKLLRLKRTAQNQIETIESKPILSESDRQKVFHLVGIMSSADVMLALIDAMTPADLAQWVAEGASIDGI